MIESEALLGLPGYQITEVKEVAGWNRIRATFRGKICCPHCDGDQLRTKDKRLRRLRHENWGERRTLLELETRKFQCLGCQRFFWQRFPGIQPHRRASEPYRRSVYRKHYDGISRSRLSRREGISGSTVERWFLEFLQLSLNERRQARCPQILGIDEHFFSRRHGYATTFCDLRRHRIHDVVLGRSEASLESYLNRLEGKHLVRVVCMDLASVYRSLVRKHFPKARIVADRFHVIRLINQQFLDCWKQIDPAGARNRGLLSLMRRHRHNLRPEQQVRLAQYLRENAAIEGIYRFKQRLCYLLLRKHLNQRKCAKLIPRLLRAIADLKSAILPPLVQLGHTLHAWRDEIATMWRFTPNNGITEGFHTKMEVLQRQAYGFRNFQNYRLRVRVMCS